MAVKYRYRWSIYATIWSTAISLLIRWLSNFNLYSGWNFVACKSVPWCDTFLLAFDRNRKAKVALSFYLNTRSFLFSLFFNRFVTESAGICMSLKKQLRVIQLKRGATNAAAAFAVSWRLATDCFIWKYQNNIWCFWVHWVSSYGRSPLIQY